MNDVEKAKRIVELVEEKTQVCAGIDELNAKLAKIDSELSGLGFNSSTASPVKKRGRPKRSENNSTDQSDDRPNRNLGQLLIDIIKQNGRSMTLNELVHAASNAGVRSSSKNFANTVYQILRSKVKQNSLVVENRGQHAKYDVA